jgi:DNA-binding transcriptional LysR family regulator
MELIQLRCFLAVAEDLHFGRAARRLEMLPASLGRHIKNLEDRLGTTLLVRTTRHVALSETGLAILEEARQLVDRADALEARARAVHREQARLLRIGAIDSASIGLVPQLLTYFRQSNPDIEVSLHEQKTIRLLPRMLSGRLDLAIVRPPERPDKRFVFRSLLAETAVVAVPVGHRLASRPSLYPADLEDEPLIVPDRHSRPHSHDLTIKIMLEAGLSARIGQVAEEKHTIVNMVSAGLGLAIVPRWSSRLAISGVQFIPILGPEGAPIRRLLLAAAFVRNTRDPARDLLLDCLDRHLDEIAETA